MDEHSLEKIVKSGPVDYIYIRGTLPIDELISKLQSIKQVVIEKGYTGITIGIDISERDSERGEERFISIIATRLETELEWHSRLEWRRDHIVKNIENTKEAFLKENERLAKITEIEEALSKSSLKCEECGKPYIAISSHQSKLGRICLECVSKSKGI